MKKLLLLLTIITISFNSFSQESIKFMGIDHKGDVMEIVRQYEKKDFKFYKQDIKKGFIILEYNNLVMKTYSIITIVYNTKGDFLALRYNFNEKNKGSEAIQKQFNSYIKTINRDNNIELVRITPMLHSGIYNNGMILVDWDIDGEWATYTIDIVSDEFAEAEE